MRQGASGNLPKGAWSELSYSQERALGDNWTVGNRAKSHLTDVACVKGEYPHRNSRI
jgi:hypothetical protein